jgi:peptidyl-prolyl cis-trans isomerase D
MLQAIRKYRKSLLGFLIVGVMVLTMLPFGSGLSRTLRNKHQSAIRVGDKEISHEEYRKQLDKFQRMVREQLGANYTKVLSMLNLEQQTVDQLITSTLLEKFAALLGLSASTQQIEAAIAAHPYFRGNVTRSAYEDFLRTQGLTGVGLEELTKKQIVAEQLQTLLSDLSAPSDAELKKVYLDENRKASFRYLSFTPANFEKQVNINDEQALKRYFTDHAEIYRKPRAVELSAVAFKPADYMAKVELTEDDVKAAYEERAHNFTVPARVKLRRIVINKKKEQASTLDKMLGTDKTKTEAQSALSESDVAKAKAEKVLAELSGDKTFAAVASAYSEDPEAAKNGGDWGWKNYPELDPKIRTAASRLDIGEHSKTIDLDDTLQILYVEDKEEKREKTFEEVQTEIERDLRKADAPEYAAAAAQAFLKKWDETKGSLQDLATAQTLALITTDKPLARGMGTPSIPALLVEKAIGLAEGEHEVFEVADTSYAVEIKQVKESHIPEFSEVRDEVAKAYRTEQSVKLAKEAANQALAKLKEEKGSEKTLEQIAAEYSLKPETTEPATRTTAKGPLFSSPDGKRILFTLQGENRVAEQLIEAGDTCYVAELASSSDPEEKDFEKSKSDLRHRETKKAGNRLMEALIKDLKTETDIYVNPELLNKENKPAS